MEIEKVGTINYKVFKERDIEQLVLFYEKVKKELSDEDTELRLVIDYKDGTSVRGVDISIFDDTKMIKLICFTLRNFKLNKRLKVIISESRGEYSVESRNEDWVEAKYSQIEKLLQAVPNQNKWLSNFRHQIIISNTLGIFLGFLLYIFFFVKMIEEGIIRKDIPTFPLVFLSLLFGQFIVGYLMNYLIFKLYPEIEFDTALEHINKGKKRKAFLLSFTTLILLPLGLNLLTIPEFQV